jgi:hypothetical protein
MIDEKKPAGRPFNKDIPPLPKNVYDETIRRYQMPDGRIVYAHQDVSPDQIPSKEWRYSEAMGDSILKEVIEGATFSKIAKMKGFPPVVSMYKWMLNHEEFRENIKAARRMRAEMFHDKAIDIADGTTDKDEVLVNKLKIDTYKWAASVNDKETFGHGQATGGGSGVTIIVNTGIERLTGEALAKKDIEMQATKKKNDEEMALFTELHEGAINENTIPAQSGSEESGDGIQSTSTSATSPQPPEAV